MSAWNFRSLAARSIPAAVVVAGFFAVVLVFVAVLSIQQGFAITMRNADSPDVAYVFGNYSALTDTELTVIGQAPDIQRGPLGPRVAGIFGADAQIRMPAKKMVGSVIMRGVPTDIAQIWPRFHLIAGRMFKPGVDEIIVGRQAERLFPGLKIGDTFDWNHHPWKVVGTFAMGGGIRESEIWADVSQLQEAYNSAGRYRLAMVRLTSPAVFPAFKQWVEHNPQLNVSTERADHIWQQQAGRLDRPLVLIGGVVTLLMTIGAIFGAINVMYANVAERLRYIATLRALGFVRVSVLGAILLEGMALALLGGVSAGLVAYLVFNGYQASTSTNGAMMGFSFAVTPDLLLAALVLALSMGFIGGLFPAIRAARIPVAKALRDA
ncbi:MAG: ABC transporter permease [Steroidobacteraceae bacterium]